MVTFWGAILGTVKWAAAAAAALCVVSLIARLIVGRWVRELLNTVAAMWRPVVLIVAAGYLLFSNDQGRELGTSLLSENNIGPICCLFLALVYWATNNWHTARLGIDRALKNGILSETAQASDTSKLGQEHPNRHFVNGDEWWLCWPPRVIGVCAHFLAAINLSLAAWNLPLAVWSDSAVLRCVAAWAAPLAIFLATVLVWAGDTHWSSRGERFASANQHTWALWVGGVAIVGELLLLGTLVIVAFYLHQVPGGFVGGTISISFSAMAFLGWISWLRNQSPPLEQNATVKEREDDDERERKQMERFTIWLFRIACLLTLLVWIPALLVWIPPLAVWIPALQVSRFLGSMVVTYLAFGAILALANRFELAMERLPKRRWFEWLFGKGREPLVAGAYVVAFVIALGFINARLHPFHRVRLCDNADCVAPPPDGFLVATSPNQRPRVPDAAGAWYKQAKAAYGERDGPVPMLIVATAGGGIRAAYWTATVLERLEKDFASEGGVRPYLFAISGVSGGSVGATAFEAALAQRDEHKCKANDTNAGDANCPGATQFLTEDFLAPTLASLFFVDTLSSFLPDFGQDDRGAAIEKSFEHASGGLLARPFLSFFRYGKDPAKSGEETPWWRPILLLNATHEETGRRIITGHVLIERDVFLDSLDALHVLGSDVRASTAAHNSARFTYVSPAGDLGPGKGSVIDGGYFENYGALSALELARAARFALKDEKPGVKLVILMISSDPDLDKSRTLVRINNAKAGGKCLVSTAEQEPPREGKPPVGPNYLSLDAKEFENAFVNSFLAPIQGIKNVREAHGNRAAAELAVEICTEFAESPIDVPGAPAAAQSPQMQTADTLDKAKKANLTDSDPVKAGHTNPYFAHLAMCRDQTPGTRVPPLGWVLSKSTRDNIKKLLDNCGNDDQLHQLEIALGKEP